MSKIAIFIHAALIKGVENRINQFIDLIINSGLINITENIFICHNGLSYEYDKIENDKINYLYLSNNLLDYEINTLNFIHKFSQKHYDYKILYVHTKGINNENPCIEDWINYMIYFLIEKHNNCLRALDYYSTAGVDLLELPTIHYSGNFWWANANYICTLPNPNEYNNLDKYPNALNSLRHNQEFWICSKKDKDNYASMWNSDINPFLRHTIRYEKNNYEENNSDIEFTFGIITDGSCDNNIEKIIDSIESNNIPKYEIIIVGNSKIIRNNTFIYEFDETQKDRCWITRKKNIIAENAKYDNIVILHDYVKITPNWYHGFLKYGNNFKICCSKIINKNGVRFRDLILYIKTYKGLGMIDVYLDCMSKLNIVIKPYIMIDDYLLNKYFLRHNLLPYSFKNNEKLNKYVYISGSYYVIKKNIALENKLDETLLFHNCEDLDLCSRLVKKGILQEFNVFSTVQFLKQKIPERWENEIDQEELDVFLKYIEEPNNMENIQTFLTL